MQPLHDDDAAHAFGIVRARGHGAAPPVIDRFQRYIALGIVRLQRVIDNDKLTTFARRPTAHRRRHAKTRLVILKTALGILVSGQLEHVPPACLIPRVSDDAPAFQRVTDRKIL